MASASPIDVNLWASAEHSRDYLKRADTIPHRQEGEAVLLEFLPDPLGRFLDVGSGAGRLLTLVRSARPAAHCVALDFSPTMLTALRRGIWGGSEDHNC